VAFAAFVSAANGKNDTEKIAHSINGNGFALTIADKSMSAKRLISARNAFAKTAAIPSRRRITVDATQGVSVLDRATGKQGKTAHLKAIMHLKNTCAITRNDAKNADCRLISL
jgi:hypothetical protein